MTQQTFNVEQKPRVVITQVHGDLQIRTWREQTILVEMDNNAAGMQQEGNTLTLADCHGDLKLTMPRDAALRAMNVHGDVDAEGIRQVELENVSGDVALREIGGDADLENIGAAIELTNLGGGLSVAHAPVVHARHNVGGDVTVNDVQEVEIQTVGGDLHAEDVVAVLRCGTVGGDCQIQGSTQTEIVVGTIGGDCTMSGATSVHTGNIGGDCEVNDVTDDVEIGYVGGDVSCKGAGGNVLVGHVGGNAALRAIAGNAELGSVGGNLELQADFPAETRTRLIVGGDAKITLPENANISIRATVGGNVSGRGISTSRGGNIIRLVYGEGAARLDMNIGGDLLLRGTATPRSASSMGSGSWNIDVDVDVDVEAPERMQGSSWSDFGHEMSQFGHDLSKLGQDLGREIAAAFSEAGWSRGADFANEMARKAEERQRQAQRKAEEQARQAQRKAEERQRQAQRKAEEQARRAHEKAARMNIRFNEREWRLDPGRLERIREQARRAANEGITGAFEAVERAMSNLGVPMRPATPPPPPTPGASTPSGESLTNGQKEMNIEQEREAILRMIAEGRVTPEEGDLLLEALEE